MLRDLLKKEIPLNDVCQQINRSMDYSSRLQLIHLLFGVSLADGTPNQPEIAIIEKISGLLGLS